MEAEYTESGVPVISKEIVRTLIRDYNKRKNEGKQSLDKYCSELVERTLKQENPNLTFFLQEIKENRLIKNTPEAFINFCFGLVSTYELFRRQIETNRLEEDLNK